MRRYFTTLRWVLMTDLARAGLFVGAAAACVAVAGTRPRMLASAVLLVVAVETLGAAPLYTMRYWSLDDAQLRDEQRQRTGSIAYASNVRVGDLQSMVSERVEQLPYLALIYRVPTVLGTFPTFDRRTQALAQAPGGERVFSRLAWWLAEGEPHTFERAAAELREPDLRRLELQPNHLSLDIHAPSDGYVVWTDTWAPGWSAVVDGQPVTVERAYGALKAVPVHAGDRRIVFSYQPSHLWTALVALGLGLAGVLAAAVVAWR